MHLVVHPWDPRYFTRKAKDWITIALGRQQRWWKIIGRWQMTRFSLLQLQADARARRLVHSLMSCHAPVKIQDTLQEKSKVESQFNPRPPSLCTSVASFTVPPFSTRKGTFSTRLVKVLCELHGVSPVKWFFLCSVRYIHCSAIRLAFACRWEN